ncbi:hypothetical protein [Lewinella sp. IMCC34183]|uniref:hypothetical protein n=1 Tax=Lewinella sp. IMCC34183 TaxID=2248762 RepID=UPI000E2213A6|nr:hypothetical protein [Lewinella sp. IMCC34183]
MKVSAPLALCICYLVLVATNLYYPKWQHAGTEATLSYDVSGYYLYLPAAFIYDDLREVTFLPDIIETYAPTYDPYQTYAHANGNQVMKYSVGQAVLYLPAFVVGHLYASAVDAYPADGFSRPYQVAISAWSLLVGFLGLFVLMRTLRPYFPETAVALSLLIITLGTNYLNYTAIDGAMTHNYVFTLYALLLYASHRLYVPRTRGPAPYLFPVVGLLIGLMALTRPTEILAVLIPLLWGMPPTRAGVRQRIDFLRRQLGGVAVAAALCILVGSLQLVYWKYVTGSWIEYSYQDQGFDFLRPHLVNGLFSYKAGWLTYTPVMWLAVFGFIALWKQRPDLLPATLLHFLLFIYVAFSWSIWWYGGSLGQRTMVQAYAVLAFPLAATLTWAGQRRRWVKLGLAALVVFCVAHNLWFTHQAHRGGLFVTEWMNRSYYWRTLFTFDIDHDDKLLLDNPEFFRGTVVRSDTLYQTGFEDHSPADCGLEPLNGRGAYCLTGDMQGTEEFHVPGPFGARQWVRAEATFLSPNQRWNIHQSAQFVLRFYAGGERVKERIVRVHRVLNYSSQRRIAIEARAPYEGADSVAVAVWNGGSSQPPLLLDDLVVTTLE